jgi:flagellar biosynthesis protein FliQ
MTLIDKALCVALVVGLAYAFVQALIDDYRSLR